MSENLLSKLVLVELSVLLLLIEFNSLFHKFSTKFVVLVLLQGYCKIWRCHAAVYVVKHSSSWDNLFVGSLMRFSCGAEPFLCPLWVRVLSILAGRGNLPILILRRLQGSIAQRPGLYETIQCLDISSRGLIFSKQT